MATIGDIRFYIRTKLAGRYTPMEIHELTRWLLEKLSQVPAHRLLWSDEPVPDEAEARVHEAVGRLLAYEPIQYIIGEAEFGGRTFQVAPGVLIPRPETWELVCLVVETQAHRPTKLLDIGTGSGCIAISLAAELPEAQVSGVDISEEALRIARLNAERNQVSVKWIHQDILSEEADHLLGVYDALVSNPPYVMEKEKATMARNVLDYEPAKALFVPDDDPLLFYRRMARLGREHLSEGGMLYFEINEQCGLQVKRLLEETGYREIELIQDFYGKDRIIKAGK